MSKFLSFPVKNQINQSNLFGANPAQYKPLGQAGHPGNDFECPTGTPIYAPVTGGAFYAHDSLGGDGIWIRFTDTSSGAGVNYNIILWHMPTPSANPPEGVTSAAQYPFQIPTDGSLVIVKAGQLLGYTDDSGYSPVASDSESTGPHLHLGVMPADANWHAIDPNNGFLGCVDPSQFFNGNYAEDINNAPAVPTPQTIEEASEVVKAIAASSLPVEQKETFLQELATILEKYL